MRKEDTMKEISEQKYSRNMALSLLAGITLGAAIVLVLLWALGYIQREVRGRLVQMLFSLETSQEDISQREPSSESQEPAPEPAATQKPEREESPTPSPQPTQEPETQQQEEDSKLAGAVQIAIDFQLSSSWDGEDGHYYQYAASIENLSDQEITDWEITVPGFDDCKVDSYWCCEVDVEDDSLIITPADFNEEIEKDGRVEGLASPFWLRASGSLRRLR